MARKPPEYYQATIVILGDKPLPAWCPRTARGRPRPLYLTESGWSAVQEGSVVRRAQLDDGINFILEMAAEAGHIVRITIEPVKSRAQRRRRARR